MTEPKDERPGGEGAPEIPPWDAAAIMRQRGEEARTERDDAIKQLRDSMSDEEILVEFGIDLGQIDG
jgi:hypothetical protein